jgi:hypothetical protein
MERIAEPKLQRKKLQGIRNIIRFNWHFYVMALLAIFVLCVLQAFTKTILLVYLYHLLAFFVFVNTFMSLAVSLYVYDLSNLYSLNWLDDVLLENLPKNAKLVNIHAGFDETSSLLAQKYNEANLQVFDFYDQQKHTEISIERARKAYPPYPNTQKITTQDIPLPNNSIDYIFLLFAAHEIRNDEERNIFFSILANKLTENGKLIVVEHLRDIPNFLAYTIGFLHFFPKKLWFTTFQQANLQILQEQKITPFVSVFTLSKINNYFPNKNLKKKYI